MLASLFVQVFKGGEVVTLDPYDHATQMMSALFITAGPGKWDARGKVTVKLHPAKVDRSGDVHRVVKDTKFRPGWVPQDNIKKLEKKDLEDLDNYELRHFKRAYRVSALSHSAL